MTQFTYPTNDESITPTITTAIHSMKLMKALDTIRDDILLRMVKDGSNCTPSAAAAVGLCISRIWIALTSYENREFVERFAADLLNHHDDEQTKTFGVGQDGFFCHDIREDEPAN